MEKIIKLEKEWHSATSEKSSLTWQNQLFLRDETMGRNCEVELALVAARQEVLEEQLRMERVRYALECVSADEEELEFFQAELDELSAACAAADNYQSLSESLSPEARECLIDWVNIHGYPKGA